MNRWPGAAALRRGLHALRRGGSAATGRKGERLAARRLRRGGYRILARNYVLGRDEADLLALAPDGRTLVIVEVKTRRGDFAPPEAAIDRGKRRRLARFGARLGRVRRFAGRPVRFDAVAVCLPRRGPPQIRHYEGAFALEE